MSDEEPGKGATSDDELDEGMAASWTMMKMMENGGRVTNE